MNYLTDSSIIIDAVRRANYLQKAVGDVGYVLDLRSEIPMLTLTSDSTPFFLIALPIKDR